jgi:N-methylhydantoinase B
MPSDTHRQIDPITLTLIWNSLISIAEEMSGALRRTAFSEAVREGEDFSAGVFDASARLVAQGNNTPGHLGAMPYVVKNVLGYVPLDQLDPGDAIVTNDSYLGGGHYPDFYMVMPVFEERRLLGYVVNTAHHVDVGGAAPGSQTVQGVTEAFQEGLRVLPVRLIRKGEFDEDLLRVILGNVRIPEKVRGDLRAQRNANHVGAERLRALYRAQGSSAVHCAVEELLARSEQRTRELISAIPDGVYSFDDVLDDVGPGTEPVRVCVDVDIKGDEAVVDFSRSSDQVKAGINSYINYTRAYATFSIRTFAKVDVPHNDGVERPIRTVARSKSFFNPEYPAPSSGRANIQIRIFDAINGALAKALPERVMGAFSHWANPIFGGVHDDTGRPWVMYDLIFGGYGGRFDKDGPEALCPVFNAANLPIEVHEANNPVLFHRFELIPDSGGAGRHRGGCGIRKDVEILCASATVSLLGDRHRFAPYGLFGGQPGRPGETVLVRGGETTALGSKERRQLDRHDIVSIRLAGAGGYGPPQERDPDLLRHDLKRELVSAEAARTTYGAKDGLSFTPSCPALGRASTSLGHQDVDGRNKSGHDGRGSST